MFCTATGDNTISAGGNTYGNDGTTYSALPSGLGVALIANGATSTVNPNSAAGGGGVITIDGDNTVPVGAGGGAVTIDASDTVAIASVSATSSMSGGSGGAAGGCKTLRFHTRGYRY